MIMDFSEFCNICFKRENLINVSSKENRTLLNTFITLISHQDVVEENIVFLCLYCCNKLEDITKFREKCITNFIHFRQSCYDFKRKLEISKDSDINRKIKIFIDGKVRKEYGGSENERFRSHYDSTEYRNIQEIFIKEEPEDMLPDIESTVDYNIYNQIQATNIKTEIVDNEYEFESEVDLGVTSFVEGEPNSCITSTENVDNYILMPLKNSTDENIIIMPPKKTRRRSKTKNGTPERYTCNICRKTFPNLDNMEKHRYIHIDEKPARCNLCRKTFSTLRYLKVHRLLHTGEKPYECDICKKTFAYSSNRNRHRLIHTGEKLAQKDI